MTEGDIEFEDKSVTLILLIINNNHKIGFCTYH